MEIKGKHHPDQNDIVDLFSTKPLRPLKKAKRRTILLHLENCQQCLRFARDVLSFGTMRVDCVTAKKLGHIL
jgi:hypothetical protein